MAQVPTAFEVFGAVAEPLQIMMTMGMYRMRILLGHRVRAGAAAILALLPEGSTADLQTTALARSGHDCQAAQLTLKMAFPRPGGADATSVTEPFSTPALPPSATGGIPGGVPGGVPAATTTVPSSLKMPPAVHATSPNPSLPVSVSGVPASFDQTYSSVPGPAASLPGVVSSYDAGLPAVPPYGSTSAAGGYSGADQSSAFAL